MAIKDFGTKIGGARKDLWKSRGLRLEDIGEFNLAERDKYITKNNAWPKIDYEKLLNSGEYSRNALYFIKTVRDAVPTAPLTEYGDTADDIRRKQEEYLVFIDKMKERLMNVKTDKDIDDLGIQFFQENGYVTRRTMYSSYTITSAGDAFINNKLFKAIQMNSSQAQRDAIKKEFLADNINSIKAQFNIFEIDGSFSNEEAWWNKGGTAIKRDRYGGTDYFYPINDTVGEYIKGLNLDIYRGNFLIVRNNYILGITHDYQEAQQFVDKMVENVSKETEKEKAAAKEAAKSNPQRKKGFVPPILAHIDRQGPEMRLGNVVGEDFIKTFGIKGGEFGNWLNENERQTNMNMAFDSFKDMARALGINDSDIAMNNKLNIAFGSRGVKGAAAHYEPLREVINLTKMKGAGSLAHEMFHAMDDISGKVLGLQTFATEKARGDNPFAELVRVMKYKTITVSVEELNKESIERADGLLDKFKSELLRMVPDRILSPEEIEERDKILGDLFEKVKNPEVKFREAQLGRTGRIKFKLNEDEFKDICTFIDNHSNIYKMNTHNKEWLAYNLDNIQNAYNVEPATEPRTRTVETEFYKNSKLMDNAFSKTTHGYWQSSTEMAARAFACYLHDKMIALGIKNDYLTGHAFQKGMDSQGNIIPLYPRPEERLEINQVFDKVIEQMKEIGVFHDREENFIAAETPNHYFTVNKTENEISFSVMDKNYNEISSGKLLPNADIHKALETAVALNDRGAQVTEIDALVFETHRKEYLRQQSMNQAIGDIPLVEDYKQLSFKDMLEQAGETKRNNEIDHVKSKQFEIIQQTNPMHDDMHVGIRSVDDIKTFEEAARDSESFCYGDFEREDAEIAITTGEITIYSSKPIEQGGFVSTSYNMAKDYAGNGKVYSKTVALSDVAWINGDEGQYAKVPEKELNKSEHSKSQSNRDKDER